MQSYRLWISRSCKIFRVQACTFHSVVSFKVFLYTLGWWRAAIKYFIKKSLRMIKKSRIVHIQASFMRLCVRRRFFRNALSFYILSKFSYFIPIYRRDCLKKSIRNFEHAENVPAPPGCYIVIGMKCVRKICSTIEENTRTDSFPIWWPCVFFHKVPLKRRLEISMSRIQVRWKFMKK